MPWAKGLMTAFWPGMVTFIVTARPNLPAGLTGGTGKIGVRLVSHPVARLLIQTAGRPLTGTSANPAGGVGVADVAALDPKIAPAVDLIVDSGHLIGGVGSTIVDVTGTRPEVLRQGAVPAKDIQAAFEALGL